MLMSREQRRHVLEEVRAQMWDGWQRDAPMAQPGQSWLLF